MTLVMNNVPWDIAWAGFAPIEITPVVQFAIYIFVSEQTKPVKWNKKLRDFVEIKNT
jgi:hypothetical protein